MSLRLRILLVIAAINVAVLLLVVQLGLGYAGKTMPIGPAAMREALAVAHSAKPQDLQPRSVRFLLRLAGGDAEFESVAWGPVPEALLEGAEDRLRREMGEGRSGFRYDAQGLTAIYASPDAEWRVFYVGFNDEALRESLGGLRLIFILLCAGTLLLILGTYLILNRLVLRPIEQLGAAARAVSEGRVPPPIPEPRGHDEIARLIRDFNRMTSEVHEYQEHLEDRVLVALRSLTAAESRLVVAQRLASTGTLAAGFAHEINNPLGGILNALRKLRGGKLEPGQREEYFDLVQEGLDRIQTLVRRILHFTPRRRQPAEVDAADVCRRAVDLAGHRAEQRGVELVLGARAQVLGVVGDAQELTQAVLNLTLNGIDAILEGRGGRVTVSARREEREVVLEVADDGVGMDPETVRRCVDLFFSTKPEGEGTGLGLGIVQHIATDHGGSLDIDSRQGEGTTVRIRLPVGTAA